MASAPLIISSILFLSSQNPSFVPISSSDLWISDSKAISAQSMNKGVVLSTHRNKGFAFAHGLGKNQSQKIQIVSPANYIAIEQCPQFAKTASLPGFKIQGKTLLDNDQRVRLSKCRFDDLELNIDQTNNAELNALFTHKELLLSTKGIRIRKSQWKKGKRTLIIDKSLYSSQQIQNILHPLGAFYKIQNINSPKPGNTLIVEITLFEFFRNAADSLGIDWPDQLKIFSLADAFDFKGMNSSSSLGLHFNQMKGLSKVIAKPRLRVQAGENAKFQSGGELPITVITHETQTTQWKPYGLLLDLKLEPTTQAGDSEIKLDFKMELSEPQLSQGNTATPAMQTRKLESKFDLRINETTLLSSMTQKRSGNNKSGINGLMNIPLAGRLFSKNSSHNQSSELWFAIRPTWEDIPFTTEMRGQEYEFQEP